MNIVDLSLQGFIKLSFYNTRLCKRNLSFSPFMLQTQKTKNKQTKNDAAKLKIKGSPKLLRFILRRMWMSVQSVMEIQSIKLAENLHSLLVLYLDLNYLPLQQVKITWPPALTSLLFVICMLDTFQHIARPATISGVTAGAFHQLSESKHLLWHGGGGSEKQHAWKFHPTESSSLCLVWLFVLLKQ